MARWADAKGNGLRNAVIVRRRDDGCSGWVLSSPVMNEDVKIVDLGDWGSRYGGGGGVLVGF